MSKQFWAVIAIVVVIFFGIFALNGKPSNSSNNKTTGVPSEHKIGTSPLNVTLVEYGDYECPYCGQYYPIVQQIQKEYNDKIVFQFRNYPLTQIHQNAFAGARAAEAASLQGKFWQMHDALYQENLAGQRQTSLSTWINASDTLTVFDRYAQQLGLNVTKFNSDFNSNKVNGTINADVAAGNKTSQADSHQDIQGTPTFFLDGKKINVGESVTAFETIINNELAKKAGKATTQTTPAPTGTTSQSKSTTKPQ
ncbi:MAG: DsbA family protein [Candidatus Saccharimonadales bacterium]